MSGIKSFVSEKQLEEKRKERQDEWDRVRNPEDPVEAPEEEYDSRSLFERLQEQKDKKQEDFEEQLKFKNHFRGIDEGESDFLSQVNKRSFEFEKKKQQEEKKELDDFRNAVTQSRELPNVDPQQTSTVGIDKYTPPKKTQTVIKKNVQHNILKNAVKRKVDTTCNETANRNENGSTSIEKVAKIDNKTNIVGTIVYPSVAKCVGILPGLAAYDDAESENSDDDSESSDENDLITNNLLSSVLHASNI